jgi:hypothetical protein
VQLDFVEEALGQFGIFSHVGGHHFHGFLALGQEAANAINATHAAFAQESDHLVIADRISDLDGHPDLRIAGERSWKGEGRRKEEGRRRKL